MQTSEVLNRAADLIETHGWVRGADGWAHAPEHVGSLCLEGGIDAAMGGIYDRTVGEFVNCPAYRAVAAYLTAPEGADYMESYIDTYLEVQIPTMRLWRWNDAYPKDASEVIEVLRAAAVIEAVRETEAAETLVAA